MWTWGDNNFGALGNGSTGGTSATPTQLAGLSGITRIPVGAGGAHAFAVGPGGAIWGWGLNLQGQLGNGITSASAIPMQVPGLTGIVQVAAASASYAVRNDGAVFAWGSDGQGQGYLGLGSTRSVDSPTQIPGLSGIIRLANGGDHILAQASSGTAP